MTRSLRTFERQARKRYAHMRPGRSCWDKRCLSCLWKRLTGGHKRDLKRNQRDYDQAMKTTPVTVMSRDDNGRWRMTHSLEPHCRCICGAEHDARGTGESGFDWYARHLDEVKAK